MNVRNIKKFLVRDIGHAILHVCHPKDRKIVEALLKHSDNFDVTFDEGIGSNNSYLRFVFFTDSAIDENSSDSEFEFSLAVKNHLFGPAKSLFVESIGKLYHIVDEGSEHASTESVSDFLEHLSRRIVSINVGKNGHLAIEFAYENDDIDDDFVLDAYIPEEVL